MTPRVQKQLVIYVDDILIIGMDEAVKEVATLVQGLWATSPLTGSPLRFLGMELSLAEDEKTILVGQQAYIEELGRNHGVPLSHHDKIPVAKESANFNVMESDIEPDEEGVAKAQRITGKLLWLSQKSRPGLSYGCSLLSSLTLQAPYRAIDVGMKMIRYLRAPRNGGWLSRKLPGPSPCIRMQPSPDSAKSHTGWVIMWGDNPIAWRSSRQGTVALSTAEAELTAILEGAIALLGIESPLVDLNEEIEDKRVGSDSMSALTISAGNGSWRTRHLRLKAAWLQEKLGSGEVDGYHVPGLGPPHQGLGRTTNPRSTTAMEHGGPGHTGGVRSG